VRYTGSAVADKILKDWPASIAKFVRVMPKDYKRALAAYKRVVAQGLSGDAADMAAFQENMKDLSRVGGN
jgi:glutamate synthase (ferredoxin)